MHKQRHEAHPESVLLALHALGAPLASDRDVPSALAERRQILSQRVVEPGHRGLGRAPQTARLETAAQFERDSDS
jgi:hypothetical protein